MGIFERLKQMAKSEVSDIKRVLRETDGSPRAAAEAEERERQRLVAEAEAELARGDAPAGAAAQVDVDVARGAAMWAPPAESRTSSGAASAAPATLGEAYPRDVREAYAVLELPLGSDRHAVAQAVVTLEERFRDPRFQADPKLAAMAAERTALVRAAGGRLDGWLATA
jgi:hypothetical protein